jgi:hypothetical protein
MKNKDQIYYGMRMAAFFIANGFWPSIYYGDPLDDSQEIAEQFVAFAWGLT